MKDDDIVSNNSGNQTFQEVIEARISRRDFLGGGLATARTRAWAFSAPSIRRS
jgi:secreted PhoX family phosphatase